MNVPNYLTISRILSVPLLIWILSTNVSSSVHGEKELLAAAVFSLAAITDRLDGYLARKHGLITRVGMLLDPLADKLLIASALIVLVQFNPKMMPAWIAIIVIGREFLVTDLRVIAASEGLTIQARDLGKWKMGVQIAAVLACILDRKWPVGDLGLGYVYLPLPIEWIGRITIWAMVILSIASAADYFAIFWNKIDSAAKAHRRSVRPARSRVPSKMSPVRE
ncbi:MAG TPA: CDP-diacylglycerol--glycerol-3-phosphate 3-phosphatidyltransferase [Verrucomicrobiae bacterium]|nr:CDP-diacylglycerol--glycerol-3-phosphate 3-phosphatidyltransferase [Verrucomicrobiae bacterium]